jgi:hypothetical protein
VQRARSELKEVNSVRFLNIMTEKLADATPVTAVLAVGLKDGFVWSEQTLGDYSEKTIMREARLAVVKCDPPGNPNGNLQYESECTIGKDHTITRLIANVTWEWQAGVKYLPQGDYTYSKVRTVGTCTEQSSAAGPLAGTGYLFVFDDKARQKELGYGYEARFNNIPAVVTMSRSCGEGARLQADIDWIPVMHGFPGAGGKLSGVMPAPGCQASQPAKLTWDFSIPPAKK